MMIHLDRQRRYTSTRCGKTDHSGSDWVGAFGLVGALMLRIDLLRQRPTNMQPVR